MFYFPEKIGDFVRELNFRPDGKGVKNNYVEYCSPDGRHGLLKTGESRLRKRKVVSCVDENGEPQSTIVPGAYI